LAAASQYDISRGLRAKGIRVRRIIIGPNNYNAWRGDRGDSSELRRQFADQHLRFISNID